MKMSNFSKILVTGFRPFLGAEINPSELLSIELSKTVSGVDSLILPVEFSNAFECLNLHLQNRSYEHVLMLGLASGRKKIGFEKIGLNWIHSENRDERGTLPESGHIQVGLPLALMSTINIEKYCAALRSESHPVEISFSAGTFVCNDLYFRVLNTFPKLNAVFIHVPPTQEIEMPQQIKIIKRFIDLINAGI